MAAGLIDQAWFRLFMFLCTVGSAEGLLVFVRLGSDTVCTEISNVLVELASIFASSFIVR